MKATKNHLLGRLKGRIEAIGARSQERGELGATADELAEALEQAIASYVAGLVQTKAMQRAVLERERLAAKWNLSACGPPGQHPPATREALTRLAAWDAPGKEAGHYWPPEVSPEEVAVALERTKDRDAAEMARLLREGIFYVADGRLNARTEGASRPPVDEARARAVARWPVDVCALVVACEREVRDDARRKTVPIPSTREAAAALAVLSQGPKGPWEQMQRTDGGSFELVWAGERRAYQLALHFGTPDFDVCIIKGILDELQEDGLRDWLLLHRMAAEQGRKGSFVWRWSEHRDRSAYARRVRQNNVTDRAAAEAVTARLWRLKSAEVRAYRTGRGAREGWVRLGPFGLLDIPAGIRNGTFLESAMLAINPALYEGARHDSPAPHFALLPEEALLLDGKRLRLATMATLAMRYARDEGCVVQRKARSLWEDLNAESGAPPAKRWPRAEGSLHQALDELGRIGVLGAWERAPGPVGPEVLYTLRPPPWLRDQLVHGVTPELGPSKVDLPATGAALIAWRLTKGWSQAQAAKELKVGIATIKRAEGAQSNALGPALTKALVSHLCPPAVATPELGIAEPE
jgi:hypothetical protein